MSQRSSAQDQGIFHKSSSQVHEKQAALCLSDKRPNNEFLRQSHEYIIQVSPTAAQSRLHS